ncbi:putative sugar-binding periplasmic protein precursor [Clostridium puniceum]|uniref:Putative sugar-binding periplasmic protein n=1 Tax=Clostridium puniceum TaxID=29367 RepID=A0A1S8TLZ1_9CLOT|nr:extracellular solute-binding protein [Clostridium puniceum]OOM78788.1 putative sugar-binding periplasmic protein precursor [Clostridium puniceum]
MKKRVKILVALGVATVMSMSALAGCAGKSSGGSSAQNTKEVKKPEKILWYINVGLSAQQKYEEWKIDFTKKTGIELDFTPMNNNDYKQNLELAFASKKAPDVFNLAGEDDLPRYASQGALADLTDLVKASGLITNENKAAWDSVTIDGKIYGVPFELNSGTITYVRKDWLDKLGLKVPTTYDEYINMLRAFKTLPECKTPVTAAKLYEDQAVTYLKDFYQDATPEFTKVDGKWVDGMQQENMKGALKRMQDAYKEGLLDQEVVTNTTSACRDKWFSGGVGVFNYWAANWAPQLDDRLKANVPTAQMVAIPPIKESKNYLLRVPAVTCISKDCKNVEGVFKYFVQYMHDGGEGQILFQNGVEGVHWKQDGDYITMLENPENPKEPLQKAFYAPYSAITPMKDSTKNIVVDSRVTSSNQLMAKYGIQSIARPVSKKLAKINGDLIKLKAKSIAQIVMGKSSVEDGFNAYINEAKNLGIDDVIKEMNGDK